MSLRLLEVVVPAGAGPTAEELLQVFPILGLWRYAVGKEQVLLRILVQRDLIESVTDTLSRNFHAADGFRVLILPVEATVPEPDLSKLVPMRRVRRVSREELYYDIAGGVDVSPVFVAMVVLSTLVAALGLIRNDVAIIIGAMVIAPLLSPNMALSLAVALGDAALGRKALAAGSLAMALVMALTLLLGWGLHVNPDVAEIAARTQVGMGHVALALVAGAAGALSFTSGLPAALIGVMVAVALLPPLATCGLLLGSGHWLDAIGAALLYAINVACLNLAAIVTFEVQGIRPRAWWHAENARRAVRVAAWSWLLLLLLLAASVAAYGHYVTVLRGG